jgi:outer membrane lipoprotein-sorting protein
VKIALLICAAALVGRAETLADILGRMDRAAHEFKNMTAAVKNIEYTDVLHESAETTGTVRLKRGKNVLAAIMEFGEPNPYTVHLIGRKVEIFKPKAGPNGTVEEYDAGKLAKNMDQFLLLGFGTTGAELKKEYTIALGPAETIDGVSTTRIDLNPKSAELKKLVTKVELWIPASSGNPVREKVLQPSKDYRLVTYSNLKVDTDIPDSAFELNLPKGVKRVQAK